MMIVYWLRLLKYKCYLISLVDILILLCLINKFWFYLKFYNYVNCKV